ncbi:ribosome assembly RNA-binding protein YhbY [Pelagibaculum spongiae]|uniref:Ribosome assembly RNA-binding protein YhbY n=1 Tax=Pelagibaculum spongiae TaxID=2080658 RepID=A0A2V1H3M5_9GAMM|nr:ribosome assembly RNA-binding protein YhbY [Pelagibaculum spongiae]PVZ71787.1 ribosome assembly RNA-binding protein YhbY [Pelagibaculum spongiae]
MHLAASQKRFLKSQAHSLKPLIIIGDKGYTNALEAELLKTLDQHELIKVRVNAGDREQRAEIIEQMCKSSGASLVGAIGHVAIVFLQRAKDSNIDLPKAK